MLLCRRREIRVLDSAGVCERQRLRCCCWWGAAVLTARAIARALRADTVLLHLLCVLEPRGWCSPTAMVQLLQESACCHLQQRQQQARHGHGAGRSASPEQGAGPAPSRPAHGPRNRAAAGTAPRCNLPATATSPRLLATRVYHHCSEIGPHTSQECAEQLDVLPSGFAAPKTDRTQLGCSPLGCMQVFRPLAVLKEGEQEGRVPACLQRRRG